MKTIGITENNEAIVIMTRGEIDAFKALANLLGEDDAFNTRMPELSISPTNVIGALSAIYVFARTSKELLWMSEELKSMSNSLAGLTKEE